MGFWQIIGGYVGIVAGVWIGRALQTRLASRPLIAIAVGLMQFLASWLFISFNLLIMALSFCLSVSGIFCIIAGIETFRQHKRKGRLI